MGNLSTPNTGEGTTNATPASGAAGATRKGIDDHQINDLEESDSEPEHEKEEPEKTAAESSITAYMEQMFSKRFDAMQSMVERLPGVAPPSRRSNPDSYTDTPFAEEIASVEMPRKFSFPNIKMYDGIGDPDDHIAQYKQRMLAVALPKESREATMCKGFGSTLIGPALQWYINLPTRSISSFAGLRDNGKRTSLAVPRLSPNRIRGPPDQTGETEKKDPPKRDPRTLEAGAGAGSNISHLSISTPELVNTLRQMGQQVKWPPKMEAPDSLWNPGLCCDFHRNHGHKTEDCVAQKIEVNELLQKGHLREFLSEKAKAHLSKEASWKSKGDAPSSPPRQDRVIHVISGGFEVSGVSHAAAKKSTRNAKHGLETAQPKCLLLDHLKGEDQGLIAITEETSDPAESGIRGQQQGQSRNLLQGPDPISKKLPESLRRPLRIVSLKNLQSYTCSQNLVPARLSSSASHRLDNKKLQQLSTGGLADKRVGHKHLDKTPSEESPQQAPDGDRGPPNPFAPVDEGGHMLHGGAENLHR
uniref:Retrotransposon gag domain-containing protein n=1 Tax=Brassica oleracea var. oleracea TaxID=109376 RepID=A0A0D3D4P5_BRAOL